MSSMEGKVALVTGGSAGIGHAAALHVPREGAYVSIGDVQVARGEQVVEEIEAAGGKALFVATDVSKWADVSRLVDETIRDSATSTMHSTTRARRVSLV